MAVRPGRSDRDGLIGTGPELSTALSAGTHEITASVTDTDGLAGAARVTVVVSDAVAPLARTFASIARDDGLVVEASESSETGGLVDSTSGNRFALRIGDVRDRQVKTILSFDTSAIPDDATIVSATLRLRRAGLRGDPFPTHGDILVDIRQGAFGGDPLLHGSDFEADATAVAVGVLSRPTQDGDWAAGAILPVGLDALNRTALTQIRVYFAVDDDDDAGSDFVAFNAGDDRDPAVHPQLVVVYQP